MSIQNESVAARKPHVSQDLQTRSLKGRKIEHLLNLASRPQPFRLLEVGTGSGGIAHYFGQHSSLQCEVDAVDVIDNRVVSDGYRYQRVEGTSLPFADHSFDVVISNHVIEHVGDENAQRHHLAELRRVLCVDGVGYLAVPNRWMVIEPHYRLAFLSWLPRPLRTPFVRLMRRGDHYDCEPLTLRQAEGLLSESGLSARNICVEALRLTLSIEGDAIPGAALAGKLPDSVLESLRWCMPTLIFRFTRDPGSCHSGAASWVERSS